MPTAYVPVSVKSNLQILESITHFFSDFLCKKVFCQSRIKIIKYFSTMKRSDFHYVDDREKKCFYFMLAKIKQKRGSQWFSHWTCQSVNLHEDGWTAFLFINSSQISCHILGDLGEEYFFLVKVRPSRTKHFSLRLLNSGKKNKITALKGKTISIFSCVCFKY